MRARHCNDRERADCQAVADAAAEDAFRRQLRGDARRADDSPAGTHKEESRIEMIPVAVRDDRDNGAGRLEHARIVAFVSERTGLVRQVDQQRGRAVRQYDARVADMLDRQLGRLGRRVRERDEQDGAGRCQGRNVEGFCDVTVDSPRAQSTSLH